MSINNDGPRLYLLHRSLDYMFAKAFAAISLIPMRSVRCLGMRLCCNEIMCALLFPFQSHVYAAMKRVDDVIDLKVHMVFPKYSEVKYFAVKYFTVNSTKYHFIRWIFQRIVSPSCSYVHQQFLNTVPSVRLHQSVTYTGSCLFTFGSIRSGICHLFLSFNTSISILPRGNCTPGSSHCNRW